MRVLVVGAGFAGTVFARLLADWPGINVEITVIDQRAHIGGNCYSYVDQSGIEIHRYGPHIFHTNSDTVWDYLSMFTDFNDYRHKVFTVHQDKVYSLPINLHTINQFFERSFSPEEAKLFIAEKAKTGCTQYGIKNPKNFEEKAISLIGVELYEAFFRDYTIKQWGRDPVTLPAQILTRLPVRFNYDTTYFANAKHQGIPKEGYWVVFQRMLDHPKIRVELEKEASEAIYNDNKYDYIIWTGSIDAYFKFRHGVLEYRSCYWTEIRSENDYLGTAVMNYPESHYAFTRAIDFKHFTPEKQFSESVAWLEHSTESSTVFDLFYPIRDVVNLEKLAKYAKDTTNLKRTIFVGRLANYQYYDMDQVIASAMSSFKDFIENQ